MTRTLKPEEARLWSLVVATVRPARIARSPTATPEPSPGTPKPPPKFIKRKAAQAPTPPPAPKPPVSAPPERIEPGRLRRIAWWDWPDDIIFERLGDFRSEAIEAFCERYDPASGSGR